MQGNFGNNYGYGQNGMGYGYRSGGFGSNNSFTSGGNGYGINYGNTPVPQQNERIYVTGRIGADAYPLPNGVFSVILWDNSAKRFYIKGYDNNGIPRVLEDCDYSDHVEPEPQTSAQLDMSQYATKDDIRKMISEAFNHIDPPVMNDYVTTKQFNDTISNLVVGNGGKVVMNNGAS